MIIKRYQVGIFLNFVNKKIAYVTNRLQKSECWQRLCLEIVFLFFVFSFDWDLRGEYRQLIVQVGGA